jgi:type IV pilus assembly protein PilC
MPSFTYSARDGGGAAVAGTLVGDTIADVIRMLRADGKFPTRVEPAEDSPEVRAVVKAVRGVKVRRADVIVLATQLSVMVDTGVMLSEGLDCIAEQTDRPAMRSMLADMSQHVRAGGDFSSACERHPRSFPAIFIALIRASEKSGMLGKLMIRATGYLRDEQETLRRVRGALAYPAVMTVFALTTTIFLLTGVMPKFTAIYAAKGAALPTPTRLLMACSGAVTAHPVGLPVVAVLLAAAGYWGYRTPTGQVMWHWSQLRLPLLGGMFRKLHLSRGIRTIGTMAGSGVGLVDCVQIAQSLSPNTYFRRLWVHVGEQIQAGKQFSEPLFGSNLVPRPIAQMISSGEKSGRLSQVMEQISAFSEQELKEKITETTRYIEPLMIAILGGIIGTVTIALLLPIFTISKVVAK